MKKLLLVLILFSALALPSVSFGQECLLGRARGILPLDKEELTVSSVAVSFNDALIKQSAGNAAVAVITVENDSVRYWVDGSTPTSSSGHLALANTSFTICGLNSIDSFSVIRVTTDAELKASFFRAR